MELLVIVLDALVHYVVEVVHYLFEALVHFGQDALLKDY